MVAASHSQSYLSVVRLILGVEIVCFFSSCFGSTFAFSRNVPNCETWFVLGGLSLSRVNLDNMEGIDAVPYYRPSAFMSEVYCLLPATNPTSSES